MFSGGSCQSAAVARDKTMTCQKQRSWVREMMLAPHQCAAALPECLPLQARVCTRLGERPALLFCLALEYYHADSENKLLWMGRQKPVALHENYSENYSCISCSINLSGDLPRVATCSLFNSSVEAGRNLRMIAAAKPNKGTAVTMRKALSAASWHCLSKHTPGTKAKTPRIPARHVTD